MIILSLVLLLSLRAADKTQYFINLSFDSILQLINAVLGDLQKLLKDFNSTAVVALFGIPFFPSALAFPNNLALYLKDLKSLPLAIFALKLVASS